MTHEEATEQLIAPGAPFEIDVVEIRGAKTRTWKHAHPSIRSLYESTRRFGDLAYLVYEDERYSYEEVYQRGRCIRYGPRDALRRQEGRPRRDRDAKLSGVADRLLGDLIHWSGRGPTERVVGKGKNSTTASTILARACSSPTRPARISSNLGSHHAHFEA